MSGKPCPLLPVQNLALDVHICRTVLGDGSFQRCTDSCVSISLTHLQPWSAVMLGDMWRQAAEQINDRNTFAYTCEYTVPSIGGVHAASSAGTDRTGLRHWDLFCIVTDTLYDYRQITSLCLFIFLPTCKMGCLWSSCGKWGQGACPESLSTTPW